MDETSLSQRTKLVILIFTILIHALLLVALFVAFLAYYRTSDAHELPDADARKHAYEQPIILGQSPTNDQASVILYDEPSAQPVQQPSRQEDPTPEAAQETVQENVESVHDAAMPQRLAIDDLLHQLIPERAGEHEELVEEKEVEKPRKKGKKGKKNRPTTQPITLSQITQGFLKSMHAEQGAAPRTHIDQESMARHRYGTKVWSLLRQSYRAYRAPTHLYGNLTTDATFVMTIAKDGKLLHAELQHPHKNHDIAQIEQCLTLAANKAGLFPPIPQAFNVDSITLSYPLGIQGQEGVHTYDFHYY